MKEQTGSFRAHHGLILALVSWFGAVTLAAGPISPASAQEGWSYTGSLNTARSDHSATLLQDGKVLVVGGSSAAGALTSAELYDPITGTWSFTGSLNTERFLYTATLLGNGKVLVAGGYANRLGDPSDLTRTAELYDPATGEWSFTGDLNVFHLFHTATLLPNGKVLYAGGAQGGGGPDSATDTAELYDPNTGTWSFTGNLGGPRALHAATRLLDGKVLVAGGCDSDECHSVFYGAELYDPNTGTWSFTGSLNNPRYYAHTLTTLPNGNVLASGGLNRSSFETTNELYNQATGSWSFTSSFLNLGGAETVTLLPSGRVLATGAFVGAELYDPATGTWSTTASRNTPRYSHTATLLADGRVLIAGGVAGGNALRSAELYGADTGISADTDADGIPDSVEPLEGRNPLVKDNDIFTVARLFVMQQYRDFLGREGDPAGVSFWTDQLITGAQTRAQLVDAFFTSAEFAAVNPVARLYFAYFLRIPDYGGLLYWVGQYRAGMTLQTISQDFAGSQEFINRYGSLSNQEFVSLVYQNVLGRPADPGGLAFWTGHLDGGAMTRGQVMLAFSESAENLMTSFNKVFVVQIYVGMLRRSPEQGGFDFWVGQLNGGRSRLDLINGFLAAREYHDRFLPPL